jgi:hypothetical protein
VSRSLKYSIPALQRSTRGSIEDAISWPEFFNTRDSGSQNKVLTVVRANQHLRRVMSDQMLPAFSWLLRHRSSVSGAAAAYR